MGNSKNKRKKSRRQLAEEASAPAELTLEAMPEGILEHVLGYFEGDEKYLSTHLSLWWTSKHLHRTMKAPDCAFGGNIIVHFMGGADKIREYIAMIVLGERMLNDEWFQFRGDAIEYLTQVTQDQMAALLKKARAVMNHRWRAGDPEIPELSVKDLRLVGAMMRDDNPYAGPLVDNNSLHLGCFEKKKAEIVKRRTVRALAYQAGIAEISDEAFDWILLELLRCMNILVLDVLDASGCYPQDIWQGMTEEEFLAMSEEFGDLRVKYPPPFGGIGNNQVYIIVPGQIKTAAVRRGMKVPLGFVELGGDGWATSEGRTREDEIKEAANYYKESSLFGDEEDESMNDASESEGEYMAGSDSESDGEYDLDGSSLVADY